MAERRLAAVVAADVVGYSRLMQEDDRATLQALDERRSAFAAAAQAHHGRIVNAPGDSILAEFPSALEAVQASLEIQKQVAGLNAALPDKRRMHLRIGINMGAVLVDEAGAIYGNEVNVAARLESLSSPGGICISRLVRDEVRGKLRLTLDDMGERRVKNIADPVHAFSVLGLGAPAGPSLPSHTVAVLAFDNLTGDPAHDHFCDGIVEDVITDLGKINGIAVMGRQSAFAYKGKGVDPRRIAGELGVRNVVEGSVRVSGNRIRVNAQLIDAERGATLWSDRFDRTLEDMFSVGDEIAEEIVTALDVKLAHGEQARIWRKAVRSPRARELFYRGMGLYYVGMPSEMRQARELFLQVTEVEPASPWGYAQAAATHCMEAIHGWTPMPADALSAARALAMKAIELDDTVPSGHGSLGIAELFAGRHDEAVERLQRAFMLRPMCSAPRALLGYAQLFAGDWMNAIGNARSAVELNPVFPVWFHYVAGAAQHFGGEHEDAVATLQRVKEANQRLVAARLALIAARAAAGDREGAQVEAAAVRKDRPDVTVAKFGATQPFRDTAFRDRFLGSLQEAGVPA